MRIKAVLWDVDGTLLNFKKAQYAALYKCFEYFNEHLDDEMVNAYDHINHGYWLKLEKGEIGKSELLVKRFVDFFERYGILIDPVKFNEMYPNDYTNRDFVFDYYLWSSLNSDINRTVHSSISTAHSEVASKIAESSSSSGSGFGGGFSSGGGFGGGGGGGRGF